MDNLRKSVRPIITFVIMVVLAIAFLLACKFMDSAMANKIVDAIIPIGAMLMAFWFGNRNKPDNTIPK